MVCQEEDRLHQLHGEIRATEQRMGQTEAEISRAHKRMLQLDTLLGQRLRVMYENGTVSYVDVIFNSTSFSDFLNRVNALTLIVRQDKLLLQMARAQRLRLGVVYHALMRQRESKLAMLGALKTERRREISQIATRRVLLGGIQRQ